ncbi:hypothetical protein ACFYO0_44950 [Streptomyces sp. NPDC006365]|uniref:hypothetical protein n=1 Tax=Streptomyces sp. NPDC006365 TaxID=3364744 RepID=UPI0036864E71
MIGAEAEAIVDLYGSCDRKATYSALTDADGYVHDRFTDHAGLPEPQRRHDIAELTAANELDLACIDPSFREQRGGELLALFTRFHPLLSQPAWSSCDAVLTSQPSAELEDNRQSHEDHTPSSVGDIRAAGVRGDGLCSS